MDQDAAICALAALAQESRLGAFRALVREVPAGLAAGELAERLAVPPSTLSFHLSHLTHAGLVRSERHGRSIIYSVDVGRVRELFWFLGEDCCQGMTELCADPTSRIDARAAGPVLAPEERPAVMFLCSRNSARSQIAEAILRREAGDHLDVYSSGLKPAPIHPLTLQVLEEAGLDTSVLRPKDLGKLLGKVTIHHAIVVCEAANDHCPKIHPFAHHQHYWPFPDPVGAVEAGSDAAEQLQVFRDVRDAIEGRIKRWLTSPESPLRSPARRADSSVEAS